MYTQQRVCQKFKQHALKGQKHIAQGKRSDTLGMNTNNIPINALKEQKRNIY